MMNILGWNWVVDTDEMTCKNVENAITIKMKKIGNDFKGMISNMPTSLFSEIAKYRDGEKIIEEIVKTAEEVYKGKIGVKFAIRSEYGTVTPYRNQ